MDRDLHILCAHLDDFEISCNGYIFKHYKEYENIFVHLATLPPLNSQDRITNM